VHASTTRMLTRLTQRKIASGNGAAETNSAIPRPSEWAGTPSTPHQPGRVAVLTSHTIRDRADDQDHLSIQTIIVEPVRCRRQRIRIQDHHVTMLLNYPGHEWHDPA
jgi:hypothetical protein